ncbi:hypothetical protein B0O80DRAFT_398425 [Mortierella sp. GBAus27b]|nr:Phospholipase D1 [Mortierella sp. GBA43]KAI8360612.1 hypothetical protein B0O80DRAFT_398425 [Mortierella sp. GBAus27b]
MTVEETKPAEASKTTEMSTDANAGTSNPPSLAVLVAVEKLKGLGKRALSPARSDVSSDQHPLTAARTSMSTAAPTYHTHDTTDHHSDDDDHPVSQDNNPEFDFRKSVGKFLRKSFDARNISLPGSGLGATSTSTGNPLSDDEQRNLTSILANLFKRKKDKKGKNANRTEQDEEELQVWKNVQPMVFGPSAVFMGLSFMIEDKGSATHNNSSTDWNMNVILALVKVVILPYTFSPKDTKVKNRDSMKPENKTPKSTFSIMERDDKEPKEQKRFMVIWVQYGDYLPKWQIERSLDDFARLYESYNHQIPDSHLMKKKLPKPPPFLRSRFGMGSWTANIREGDANHNGNAEGAADGDELTIEDAFDPKSAKKLTTELQTFLQEMIQYAIYLPGAERMCKFLELSALTLALGRDGGYQGKEGYLTVVKQKRLMDEGPLANAVKKVIRKPISKYFVVRDSFIIVAASHKNTEIQDVILLDSSFRANKCPRHIHSPHSFDIINSELKFHVRAKSDHRRQQFIGSIRKMPALWKKPKRFNSFAPVRKNVSAQWLVDGRDYFWNASQAMEMAKETIFILDWMLTPEVLMRRHQHEGVSWTLMDVLGRKANEGVKVYIVMYSEVEAAMHLASLRAKRVLRKLCPENIWVQRHGPNLKTAWWAHHEKLVVVDNMIAFVGGLDLCFGRWDTPEHTLIDNEDSIGHRWPGQDYSNPRIKDFVDLSKPDMDNLDRGDSPRMPWHDVGLQILGQPARDVARHFIQRWNFLCRTKPKQKRIPFLLPKPDIPLSKLKEMGLEGTCEIQILRSVSSWSMGVKEPECSILTAYITAIERAEHFIYIENQFFITSTNVNRTIVHNGIGRALTDRIIKAHQSGDKFRVIVVLPLVPGFEGGINTPAATSVRMVMLSIYETICHGKNSIYGRLAAAGVAKPHKYISFYGLRNWAKFGDKFITEQVYIHSKMMIVDDRIAIIGSANINERSMLGNRDSEIAAIVRDQDYIDSTMNGMPYKVSRFAHTLRMNLMMEHLGLLGHEHYSDDMDSPDQELPFSEFDFVDPVHPAFYDDIWKHYAESNTGIYRDMFKCIPDNSVRSWSDYMKFIAQSNVEDPRMDESRTLKDKAMDKILGPTMNEHFKSGGESSGEEDEGYYHGRGTNWVDEDPEDDEKPRREGAKGRRRIPQSLSLDERMRRRRFKAKMSRNARSARTTDDKLPKRGKSVRNNEKMEALDEEEDDGEQTQTEDLPKQDHTVKRTASALAKSNDVRLAMENNLSKVQGHLVEWPLDFLRDEIEKHNFCYPKDYNHPIDLYT